MYSADPFEHWIIDDFLPTDMAQQAADHFFEGPGAWIKRHHLYSHHKETRTAGLSHQVEDTLQALECPGMLAYVSAVTGVKELHSDSMRYGGGQHVVYPQGRLGIHADFTHSPTTGMRRALNLLLYLSNKELMGGGELELWSSDMKRCVSTVPTRFNRAVIFKTSVTSYHGHPEPLPWKTPRLSLACYYYVTDSLTAPYQGEVHISPNISGYLKTTDYRPRPWEYKLRLRKWLSRRIKG